jgi:hypothetical protein
MTRSCRLIWTKCILWRFSSSTASQRTLAMISRVYVASKVKSSTGGDHLLALQLWPSTRLHSAILLFEYLWSRTEIYILCFVVSSMFRLEEQHNFFPSSRFWRLSEGLITSRFTRIYPKNPYISANPPFFGHLKLFKGGMSLP